MRPNLIIEECAVAIGEELYHSRVIDIGQRTIANKRAWLNEQGIEHRVYYGNDQVMFYYFKEDSHAMLFYLNWNEPPTNAAN